MRNLFAIGVMGLAALLAVSVRAQEEASPNLTPEQTVMTVERAWAQAYVAQDYAALDNILANDYMAVSAGGLFQTKTQLMNELKTGFVRYERIWTGPMNIRVTGTSAIVTGTDDEVSWRGDMDTSGRYIWTDVFMFHDGRWQVVSSQGTMLMDATD